MKFIVDGKEVSFPSQGPAGPAGENGKSAYDYAVAGGYTGTEEEFQALLGSGPWVPENQRAKIASASARLQGVGWYRIFKVSSTPVQLLIQAQTKFSNSLPGAFTAVCDSNQYSKGPRITILQATVQNIDGIRLVNADGGVCVDIHYTSTSGNDFSASCFANSIYALSTITTNVSQVSDPLPEGETVLLEQEITDIPSGSVVTTPPSNPNLLDNWYFSSPINQRGKTEYTVAYSTSRSYSNIDRWCMARGANTYNVATHTLTLGNEQWAQMGQPMGNREDLSGQWLTFSLLCKTSEEGCALLLQMSNSNYTRATIPVSPDLTLVSVSRLVPSGNDIYIAIQKQIATQTPIQLEIVAAKLEIGTQQTLAHKDASGNWVLTDPPPNPALELLKCQKYQIELVSPIDRYGAVGVGVARGGTFASITSPVPVPLKGIPAITSKGKFTLVNDTGFSGGIPVTKFSATSNIAQNSVTYIAYVESGLTVGACYLLTYSPADDEEKSSILFDSNI